MSLLTHLIPAQYLNGLLQCLPGTGAVDAALADAVNLPDARVPPQLMAEVLQRLALLTGRHDLGVVMGGQIRIDRHPQLGRLLASAHHLGEALALLQPYLPLLTPNFHLRLTRDARALVQEWHMHGPLTPSHRKTALECIAAGTIATLRGLFPTQRLPLSVELPIAPRWTHSALADLPDVSVRCVLERPTEPLRIVLPAWAADLPLPRRPARATQDDPQADCHSSLCQLRAVQSWRDWVAHLLGRVTDHQPSLREVAALVAQAPRTLARHLAEEGTSFRALSNAVRHERARQLLRQPSSQVSEVGRILGYTDSANFTRAFRSAEGCSPSQYRERWRQPDGLAAAQAPGSRQAPPQPSAL